MKRFKTACILAAGLGLLAGRLSAADLMASREVEAKVALESSLEKRLTGVLRKLLDTEDLLVLVNADLTIENDDNKLPEILPGVPIKDLPIAASLPMATRTAIRKISVTVLVNTQTSDADAALVKKTVSDLAGIDAARGDAVQVQKTRLSRSIASTNSPFSKFLNPGWILSLLWLLFVFGGLILIYARFLTPLLSVIRTLLTIRQSPATTAGREPAAPGNAAQPQALQAAAGQILPGRIGASPENDEDEMPFAFLRDRHLPMLKFLLHRAPARTSAVVIHYLPAKMAAAILASLLPEARQEIAVHMSKVVQLDEENVLSIEESLHSRIDYLMGGEDKLAEILDEIPASLQEEMLEAVRGKDPRLGARLSRRIVRLDDIALLGAEELKTLTRRVPIRSLAAVLKADEELRNKVLPKLTSGLGTWLSQEVSLAPTLPEGKVEEEQGKVLAALSALVREGGIDLKKGALPEPEEEVGDNAAVEETVALPPPVEEGKN